jgi:hypothetical protein
MAHGALQQSLESLRRFVEDGIRGMPVEPRRTSRLVRMVAFRARDETVDAATCVVFPGLSRCAAWIRCEDLGTRFGPSAVGAWPVLTDAILTELSGQNQPVNRPVSR